MIDTKKPIRFYDDTNKVQQKLFLTTILYEDDNTCLCLLEKSDLSGNPNILFDKNTGKVLTETLSFWYAENFDTEQTLLAKKAIEYVKQSYAEKHGLQFLMLGDVADLIEQLTTVKVNWQDFLIEK